MVNNNCELQHTIIHFKKSRNLISMSDIAASEDINEKEKKITNI